MENSAEDTNQKLENGKKKEKGKVGRPRKDKSRPIHTQTYGIVDKPQDPGNVLEMVYEEPRLFKRIFAIMKGFGINEISWNFHKDRIEFCSKDFKGKSTLQIEIDAKMLVRYYCEEPISRCIKRDELEKIFNKTLNNSHNQVEISLGREDSRSTAYITIKKANAMDFNYEIGIFQKDEAQNIALPDDAKYPIKFSIPSIDFKNLVDNTSFASDSMIISKNPGECLEIRYESSSSKSLNLTVPLQNIKLESNLPEDDIFSVSVIVAYIKPFSKANIGENVCICADKFSPITFTTEVNKKSFTNQNGIRIEGYVCKIKLITEIKKFDK